MKLKAIASCIASIGLLGLSAAPAGANPAVPFSFPEECGFSPFTQSTFCTTISGVIIINPANHGGVQTAVGHTTTVTAEYAGFGKDGPLLQQTTDTRHSVSVFKDGISQASYENIVLLTAANGATCTLRVTFILSQDVVRHIDEGFVCR
ncbi:hypothetical protein B1A87_007195 [Arthrobacter sp. KBS0703]|uniref:hypothetical protein n=1 Tax=Arthrobacter sp. KBS0703 TaxID=1955698 RepID=UPI00098ECDC9|nr:hypothetical protein [Arthrobacter sp. KBS0703]TSE15717.1 hypothetical protein B1A87_007195 [Arthrobacter sp. KBS0703]